MLRTTPLVPQQIEAMKAKEIPCLSQCHESVIKSGGCRCTTGNIDDLWTTLKRLESHQAETKEFLASLKS